MKRSMNQMSQTIVNHVIENENELINKVMMHSSMAHHQDTDQLRNIFLHFLHRFQNHLVNEVSKLEKDELLIDTEADQLGLAQNISVSAIIDGLYEMSTTIWTMFQKEAQDRFDLSTNELLHVHDLLNKEINEAVKEVLTAHVQAAKDKELQYYEKLNELSVPIINITEKIAICPLIGKIDERRGQLLMHETLEQCQQRKINRLIFDMSGVPKIDNIVASYLNATIQSLSLIGVNITLAGVQSNIAMTVIQQNIHFEKVTITSNVQRALEDAEIIS
ncbi:STAS domain-containing protein [Salipaludibacillus daqingensis]|uniref:STAS domain-containing protein n=1 Tax=Salipaludibacillus daqingensis TaxID=3041001 RepID=UPI002473E26C|nr:STAS domain-containing protein [Salipaludibacillus daqingensis]